MPQVVGESRGVTPRGFERTVILQYIFWEDQEIRHCNSPGMIKEIFLTREEIWDPNDIEFDRIRHLGYKSMAKA